MNHFATSKCAMKFNLVICVGLTLKIKQFLNVLEILLMMNKLLKVKFWCYDLWRN